MVFTNILGAGVILPILPLVAEGEFSALQSTFSLYAERVVFPKADNAVVARNVGLILTVIGFVTILTQGLLIKPLVHRFGEQWLIIVEQVSLAIAITLILPGIGLSLFLQRIKIGGPLLHPTKP